MAFAEHKGQSSEDEDESFVIELLNAQERRYGDGKARRRKSGAEDQAERHSFGRRVTTAPGASGATRSKDSCLVWSDGGEEIARAAEAAGVDFGGMLEAGVDAQQLLEFVSNYRKEEGDKLGLMDAQNLKFATSQVLRKGPRAGAEAVFNQPSGSRHSARGPVAGLGRETLQTADSQLRRPRVEVPQTSSRQPPPDRRGNGREAGTSIGGGIRHPRSRSPGTRALNGVLAEVDGEETARLCDALLRWSSPLAGTGRKGGGDGGAGVVGRRADGKSRHEEAAARVLAADIMDETAAAAKEDPDGEVSFGEDGSQTPRVTENGSGRPRSPRLARRKELEGREEREPEGREERGEDGRRRRRRQGRAVEDSGGRDRSSSLDFTTKWELDERRGGSVSPGGRLPREGVRGNGHVRPTPSYALPTKHFKTLDRDRRDVLYAEDAHRKKEKQRQVQLEEENAALKLRLEGQRRAIHELEHQTYTLREEARARKEEFSRIKKKLTTAAPSSTAGGRCSFCASSNHARGRLAGEGGASVLRKRALVAEGRVQTLERTLADVKAKEQRGREIAASLKHSYSGAQERAAALEAELDFSKKALSEVRHELAESRRDAKVAMKNTRKHNRQQGERTRELEIARAKATDLAMQLRKESKELERARLAAAGHREEKDRAEARAEDLVRENRMLQDRLSDGKLRSRTRERDRWILSELRTTSASASPTRLPITQATNKNEQHLRAPYTPPHRFHEGKKAPHSATPQPLLVRSPSDDDAWPRARARGDGRRVSRRGEVLNSTSGSDSPPRHGPRSPSPGKKSRSGGILSTGGTVDPSGILNCSGGSDGGMERASNRLPPRSRGYRGGSDGLGGVRGRAGGAGAGRAVSADGVKGGVGGGGGFGSSALSAGSANSAMGARYERLQAMYRRVNRREVGSGRRAGVG